MTEHGLELGTTILLAANYKNEPPFADPTRAKAYHDVWLRIFDDATDAEFVAACDAWTRDPSRKNWPIPAVLKTLILRLEERRLQHLAEKAIDPAEAAWDMVISELKRCGTWERPRLDSRAMRAVEAVGGWHGLCTQSYDQLGFTRRDFLSCYRARATEDVAVGALTAVGNLKLLEG